MKVKRKPHQIILIEHLFYPLMGAVFFVLAASYGPKVAVLHTELKPDDIYFIGMALGCSILAIVTILALPFSCIRLWKSSNLFLQGGWSIASKIYSVIFFFVCVVYGLLMLMTLFSIIVLVFSI